VGPVSQAQALPIAPTPSPSPEGEGNIKALANQAERAARLCKADLVTGMVGEFPELQGIMGGYYARAQGEDDAVADAIRDHYVATPDQIVSIAVALADRLDTIDQFFLINERPTGSKDPFALRRAAVQSLSMIMRGLRIDLAKIVSQDVIEFIIDRWMAQNKAAGGRADLIDAVRSATFDGDLWRMGQRMRSLETFVSTDEGINLFAGYKRAANILKSSPERGGGGKADGGVPPLSDSANLEVGPLRPSGAPPRSGEDLALQSALQSAEPLATTAIEAEDFEAAMSALATLRAPIDAFFEGVMVNDPDPDKRAFRIGLLTRFRDAVHKVADFSKIEG
jgi:glycyl-tRNA synthetase beta chain